MQRGNELGTEYEILIQNSKKNPKLEENNGLCEQYSNKIIISDFSEYANEKMTVENLSDYKNKVLRHEVIHAFLGESGLRSSSEWAENEEMVDWFAIQAPKIFKVLEELKIM